MSEDKYRSLRSKLTVFHDWPHRYVFKFIVPAAEQGTLEALFEGHDFSVRSSSGGKWVSLTCAREMPTSESVIQVYRAVEAIEGRWSL